MFFRTKILQRFCISHKHHLQQQIRQMKDNYGNVSDKIISYIGRDLYKDHQHPLGIIKNSIEQFFKNREKMTTKQKEHYLPFNIYDSFSPIVSKQENFDDLLVPEDHISRKRSDSYYIDNKHLLRTHTSAYQKRLITSDQDAFLVFADVYRRDEIDSRHYPVFHQMEAVRIYKAEQFNSQNPTLNQQEVINDLHQTCENLIIHLLGNVQMRWVPAYFPFTHPSYELEIYFQDRWMEMLGCGIIHRDLMNNCKRPQQQIGWAAGLGIERFAMILFDIPDIRLFWSEDKRFRDQFKAGMVKKFQPFSKYPSCWKDISVWVSKNFEENDLFDLIRDIGGDLVENVECVDTFTNPKTLLTSKCFRIHYRSLERTLENKEIDDLQFRIRDAIVSKLNLKLR